MAYTAFTFGGMLKVVAIMALVQPWEGVHFWCWLINLIYVLSWCGILLYQEGTRCQNVEH